MGLLDNTPTPSPNTDYGIIITQPGYNATTASSQNQIFNSSWPSLQVAFSTTVTVAGNIAHGLEFIPFTVVYSKSGFLSVINFGVATVDSTYIYDLSVGDFVVSYNIDLTKDIDFPLLNQSTEATKYDPDYGIKVVKSGKSIDSTDMRDFILHSRCQAPTVMAVKTQATTNNGSSNTIQYTNQLGYPSWNFGFICVGTNGLYPKGTYINAPFYTQSYPTTITNGITTYIEYLPPDGATLVILRNPLFATFLQVENY